MIRLRVDQRGFVYLDAVRLPMRYIPGAGVEFGVKERRLWSEYGKRVTVSLSELAALEIRRCESVGSNER
jgi:hypothetical protein